MLEGCNAKVSPQKDPFLQALTASPEDTSWGLHLLLWHLRQAKLRPLAEVDFLGLQSSPAVPWGAPKVLRWLGEALADLAARRSLNSLPGWLCARKTWNSSWLGSHHGASYDRNIISPLAFKFPSALLRRCCAEFLLNCVSLWRLTWIVVYLRAGLLWPERGRKQNVHNTLGNLQEVQQAFCIWVAWQNHPHYRVILVINTCSDQMLLEKWCIVQIRAILVSI